MTDFYRSLDRALEHEDGAYERFVEAVPRAIIAQDDTTVTFRVIPNISAIQAKINEEVARLAAVYQRPRDPSLPFWWDMIPAEGVE